MRVQQRRTHPLPLVQEEQGQGLFLLAHGAPHDPWPGDRVPGHLALPAPVRHLLCGLQ
jgi:hypothetical protein